MAASLVKFHAQFLRRVFAPGALVRGGSVRNFGYKKGFSKPLKDFYRRRLEAGPDVARRRSEWANWNYKAEIYAFGKRLGEEFNEANLKTALVHQSYVEQELKRRKDVASDDETLSFNLVDNQEFATAGEKVTSDYVKAFLRHKYPRLPEEGIIAVHDYLLSESILAHIGNHIGLDDLVLCEGFPTDTMIKQTFLAVIGCLAKDCGNSKAYKFVQDFVLPELVRKDINTLWDIVNPMGLLNQLLQSSDHGEPESRLLHSCGRETVVAVFQVGIYSDQKLIGQGFGETATIAEEEAARDALRRVFGTQLHDQQMNFEQPVVESFIDKTNAKLADFAT